MYINKTEIPDICSCLSIRLLWHRFLVTLRPNWQQAKSIAERFKTSLPPPHNPWFLDLPIEWVPQLLQVLKTSTIEDFNGDENMLNDTPRPEEKSLRIKDGVVNWNEKIMSQMAPADISLEMINDIPGPKFVTTKAIFDTDAGLSASLCISCKSWQLADGTSDMEKKPY